MEQAKNAVRMLNEAGIQTAMHLRSGMGEDEEDVFATKTVLQEWAAQGSLPDRINLGRIVLWDGLEMTANTPPDLVDATLMFYSTSWPGRRDRDRYTDAWNDVVDFCRGLGVRVRVSEY